MLSHIQDMIEKIYDIYKVFNHHKTLELPVYRSFSLNRRNSEEDETKNLYRRKCVKTLFWYWLRISFTNFANGTTVKKIL